MKTKKVILFIVEGVTDKTALGGIIDKIISSNMVKFYISGGDITSDNSCKASNALEKVNDHVKRFLDNQPGINRSDLLKVVHLIDMDGAYIGEEQIQIADVDGFLYSEEAITANSIGRVTNRNNRKQKVVNRLSLCP